jgi:uncharacterized protein YpiB (UPF0302 family)
MLNNTQLDAIMNLDDPVDILLSFKNRLTDSQVAVVIEKEPYVAAMCLKDRLTDSQIAVIVDKEPWAAAVYLKDILTEL